MRSLSGEGASAVAVQGEDPLARPEDALNALADGGEVRALAGLVATLRTHHRGFQICYFAGEFLVRVAFVDQEDLTPRSSDAPEH